MSLHEFKNPRMLVLTPDTTAYATARAMAERQLGSVVVVERGKVVGIVTDRDLVVEVLAQATNPREMRLGAIMSEDVATIDVAASAADAVASMRTNACRRLPLIEDGHVVGIVTLDDLLLCRALTPGTIASVIASQLDLAAAWSERNRRAKEPSVLGRHLHLRNRRRSHADATYSRLLHELKDATGLKTRYEAETALLITLEAICRRIGPGEAQHVLSQLPSLVRTELASSATGPDEDITADVLEAELRAQLHLGDLEATSVLLTTCKVVARHISSGLAVALRTNLPTEMKELFPIAPV